MKNFRIVTEGQSETNFVNRVMAPYFADRCTLIPITVVTKTDNRLGKTYKGGVGNYDQIRNTLVKTLANASKNKDSYVTTMFDFYRLPTDVPGVAEAAKVSNPYQKVEIIEREILKAEEYDGNFFFPYIELHEFESMIFTDIAKLGEAYFEDDLTALKECVKEQENPELINNGAETAPSKRIMNCISNFDKANVGVSVLEKIGIENIAAKCRHFDEWLQRIEELNMRTLLLLRGAPGCGKTTWIKENGLEHYTLSSDDIRIMYQSPVMGIDGQTKISQENDDAVWKTLLRILRGRMKHGDFTVIDATNARTSELNRYKELCAEYRYRVYCVDFTAVPIEEVKQRNAGREKFRKVPERVIDTMYARFATQKVPSGIKVIRPDELETVWLAKRDFSYYKAIHHIGDIHGCNTALQEYLAAEGGIKEDELYIFVGDYIDRGCENAEVVKFLLSIMDRKNVLLLEGNHEKNLWLWASEQETADREFELVTKPALEEAGIDRKAVRNLYRRFAQCAYYDYDGNTYLVTHAGLSAIPGNLSYVATEQMIMGVGKYEDVEDVAEAFRKNMPENCFQIYGHRNLKQVPLTAEGRVFNLEGQIEYGGFLRCLKIGHDGIRPTQIRNRVFRTMEEREEQNRFAESSVADLLISMRHNKYIMEKKYGNLSSFNFTDEAFYDKAWDSQTVRARGLYLDTVKGTVAARAYDKFFNIGEREETRMDRLQRRLHFPVTAYVKENGYLGIVSYDEKEDDLLVACKFTLDSLFVERLKEMLAAKVSKTHLDEMKDYLKENDVSFIFECVDMEHDPHVIEYPESRLVLLDIVKNSMETARYEYGQMCAVAERFELTHKEKACELPDWQTFFDWYNEILREDYEYRGQKIEGFVIEDSDGYMVKVKLYYYHFWKQMRAVAKEVSKKGFIANTAMLTTPVANEFYGWLREKYDTGELKKLPKDICGLRKRFLDSKG